MRPIDADALIEFCAERWIPLNIDAVNMQPTIQPEKAQLSKEGTTKGTPFDTISRQAALEKVRAMQTYKLFMGDDMILIDKAEVQTELMMLPPAQPEPHEGTWVYGEDSTADCVDGYRCSQCGFFVPWDYNHKLIDYINDYAYCPKCGARMKGERQK